MRMARSRSVSARVGGLALAMAICAGASASALSIADVKFRGTSSQSLPVSMVVSGSQIKRLNVAWKAQCPALHAPLKGITTYHINVGLQHGAWSTSGSYTAHAAGGYEERFHVRDHGVVAGDKRVTGTFSGTVQIFHGAKHRPIDTCQSGKVTFALTRAR
jgi:hypothetical protein